jgi:gamma-glutamylcyclotransferase (GGCT)/AIG2-like uncharacterized protein YtfP
VLDVREATARGRLYDLPFGFPALVVPKEDVRAEGTSDYPTDAWESGPSPGLCIPKAHPGWDVIHGEILTFGDPGSGCHPLDGLEGYRPGEPSLYRRILIPAVPSEGETSRARLGLRRRVCLGRTPARRALARGLTLREEVRGRVGWHNRGRGRGYAAGLWCRVYSEGEPWWRSAGD